ncbi:SWI/SNF and RSC complex subunit Ssr3 [Massospora cicadina]|nr:SWI/SNF and RSC complex subunit Ssr3 [Massospora cicadina]
MNEELGTPTVPEPPNPYPQLRKRVTEPNPTLGMRPFKMRRPTERTFSEKITQLIPESKLYNELLDTEKRLDAIMLRKRLECLDARGKPSRVYRTVRVFISNTACFQPEGPASPTPAGCVPAWTLRVEGRMLDIPAVHSKHKHSIRKFSTLVRSLVIELDPALYPDGYIVEWAPKQEIQEADGFEIKRAGTTNVNAKIILQMNHPTDRFLPSPELRAILTVAPLEERSSVNLVTKSDVITTLWQYVKFYDLQDKEDKLTILCDERLKKLFKLERVGFSQLPNLLHAHLLPPEPIAIDYVIRVDKPETVSPVVFDIEMETDDEFKTKVTSIIGNNATNRAIYNLDEKIAQVMTAITNAKVKREFLLDFVASPIDFINRWVASQTQDLDLLYGDTQVNLEESRAADFYNQDWAKESVLHYLASQAKENVANSLAGRNP